ncbi:MAG: hypothetical protein SPF62_10060 [Prevotella sp.]|nr:hypothetical protein [Prevotella sp.]
MTNVFPEDEKRVSAPPHTHLTRLNGVPKLRPTIWALDAQAVGTDCPSRWKRR